MTVDDMAEVSFHFKFIQNHIANLFLVAQMVVFAFNLFVCLLIGNEIAFKSSHLVFVE